MGQLHGIDLHGCRIRLLSSVAVPQLEFFCCSGQKYKIKRNIPSHIGENHPAAAFT
jgi:hypothetical protein